MNSGPFALFALVDVSTKTLEEILETAKGHCAGVLTFWVATDDYSDPPKKKEREVHEGDGPPIKKDYKSFVGQKVEDVAKWMRNRPEDVDLDKEFFAILDTTVKDGDIVVCRLDGKLGEKAGDLDYMRFDAGSGASSMRGGPFGWWETAKENQPSTEIKY